MRSLLGELMIDEGAASLPEYAMLVALIAVAALVALAALGDGVQGVFRVSGDAMNDVVPASGS